MTEHSRLFHTPAGGRSKLKGFLGNSATDTSYVVFPRGGNCYIYRLQQVKRFCNESAAASELIVFKQ